MRFKLSCKLTDSVNSETPFLFNLSAQSFDGQVIDNETLSLSPLLTPEDWTMPESGNTHATA